jgi:hypothetical protein
MNKARARSAKSRRRNIVSAPLKGNIAQIQDQQLNQLLLSHLCSDTALAPLGGYCCANTLNLAS